MQSVLDYLKPYLNLDLYKAELKHEKEKKKENAEDQKIIKEYNTKDVQFTIDNNIGGDVFDENIPLILEDEEK